MKAYSIDLRQRVLGDCDAGMTTREVATKFRVSESWVRRLKQRRRETGEIGPRRAGSPKPPGWLGDAERLKQLVDEQPDVTLRELQAKLGQNMSVSTISRALRALGLTFKKSHPRRRARPSRRPTTSYSVASYDDGSGCRAIHFHRRDLGENEHGAPLRSLPTWRAFDCQSAARPLENNDVRRIAA